MKVESFSDLAESPHSWDKRVLNITPVKSGRNYRFRLGLQMFRMKTNESYSLIVELYNRDYKTWQRQQTYVNGTGMWVISSNTAKYQHQYGSSGDLYYAKTLIKFKKTSSSPPIFVYFTVHFDDNGGDMNTYPKDFKNQVYIVASGIEGLTDHVDSEVYDDHEAFEIDKTKMKMLVPLDMNGKQLMNVNYDLKFGNLFKITTCYINNKNINGTFDRYTTIKDKRTNRLFSISSPIFLFSINFYITTNKNTNDLNLEINSNGNSFPYLTHLNELNSKNYQNNNFKLDMAFKAINKPIYFHAGSGIRNIGINYLNGEINTHNIDILFSYL